MEYPDADCSVDFGRLQVFLGSGDESEPQDGQDVLYAQAVPSVQGSGIQLPQLQRWFNAMKKTTLCSIAAAGAIGLLTYLMGYPVFSDGVIHWKNICIIILCLAVKELSITETLGYAESMVTNAFKIVLKAIRK